MTANLHAVEAAPGRRQMGHGNWEGGESLPAKPPAGPAGRSQGGGAEAAREAAAREAAGSRHEAEAGQRRQEVRSGQAAGSR